MSEIDTTNKFMVARGGDKVLILGLGQPVELSQDDALIVAAWMIALCDDGADRFGELLDAVLNT